MRRQPRNRTSPSRKPEFQKSRKHFESGLNPIKRSYRPAALHMPFYRDFLDAQAKLFRVIERVHVPHKVSRLDARQDFLHRTQPESLETALRVTYAQSEKNLHQQVENEGKHPPSERNVGFGRAQVAGADRNVAILKRIEEFWNFL